MVNHLDAAIVSLKKIAHECTKSANDMFGNSQNKYAYSKQLDSINSLLKLANEMKSKHKDAINVINTMGEGKIQ